MVLTVLLQRIIVILQQILVQNVGGIGIELQSRAVIRGRGLEGRQQSFRQHLGDYIAHGLTARCQEVEQSAQEDDDREYRHGQQQRADHWRSALIDTASGGSHWHLCHTGGLGRTRASDGQQIEASADVTSVTWHQSVALRLLPRALAVLGGLFRIKVVAAQHAVVVFIQFVAISAASEGVSALFLASGPDLPSIVLARAAAVLENAVLQGIEGRWIQALCLALLASEGVAVTEQTVVATCCGRHPVLVVGVVRARSLPAVTRALMQVIKVRAQQESVHLRIALFASVEEEVRIQSTGLGDDALEIKGLLFVGGECALGEGETFVPSVAVRHVSAIQRFMNEVSNSDLHE